MEQVKQMGVIQTGIISGLIVFSSAAVAFASDFRVAPKPADVKAMNDIDLCKHDYVRSLKFIQNEVKSRYLNCTAILALVVEKKQKERQAREAKEMERREAEQRRIVAEAEQARRNREQQKLDALREQRRQLVEMQRKQLQLQQEQMERAKSRDRSRALMALGAALSGFAGPAPTSASPFRNYSIKGKNYTCTTTGSFTNCD